MDGDVRVKGDGEGVGGWRYLVLDWNAECTNVENEDFLSGAPD